VLRQPCPALRSTSSPPKYAILDEAGVKKRKKSVSKWFRDEYGHTPL